MPSRRCRPTWSGCALNLALNERSENVVVIPAAVVECERPVRFLVGPSGGMGKADGSAGREDVAYSDTVDIDGLSLDAFVFEMGNPPPQVVKMDIEGGEVLALPGMQRVLEQARPLLLLELHGPEAAQVAWETLDPPGLPPLPHGAGISAGKNPAGAGLESLRGGFSVSERCMMGQHCRSISGPPGSPADACCLPTGRRSSTLLAQRCPAG